MTPQPHEITSGEVRLASESIEAIARRVADLLRPPPEDPHPRRLWTAAEVSRRWGVERSWVYANADRLGARRLGAGTRPRLRFDPAEVAERLGTPNPDGSRGPARRPIAVDTRGSRSIPPFGERELSWSRN